MDFAFLFGKIIQKRLIGIVLSAFLQKDSHHGKLAIRALVYQVQFRIRWPALKLVLTRRVEVELL